MSMIRWDPYRQMRSFRDAMDRLFNEPERWMSGGEPQEMEAGLFIPMDIVEQGDRLVISAVAPGVKPEDLDISVSGNTLTIRGEIKREEHPEGTNVFFQERLYGTFSRSISMPAGYNLEGVEAMCQDGVIRISVPKAEEAKPKQIKVKAGQPG